MTWASGVSVLRAIADAEEGSRDVAQAARAAAPELDERSYGRVLALLVEGGLATAELLRNGCGDYVVAVATGVTVRGLRQIGRWPAAPAGSTVVSSQIGVLNAGVINEVKSPR